MRPSRLASAARRAALAIALLGATSAPAHAQLLKRVKQIAQDRAADAAARALAGDRAGPSDQTAGEAAAPAAAVRRAPLAITPERLDAFLVAMRPAAARAERARTERAERAAYDSAVARHRAAEERRDACGQRVLEQERPRLMRLAATDPMALQRLSGGTAELGALGEQIAAAAASNDAARLRALGDSARAMQYRAQVAVLPALRACGAPAPEPAPARAWDESSPEQHIVRPPDMTATQFGRLRERVAIYALSDGRNGDFSPEERGALGGRAADLRRLAPLFRDGLLEWAHWGELGRLWNAASAAQ